MGDVRTLLTFEQFEQLPDNPGKCELLGGELIELPPAKRRHNFISERLYLLQRAAVESLQARRRADLLGEVHHEMGYRLGPLTWLQPDVSITHATQTGDDHYEGSPALAVEIVPESNTPRKVARKVEALLANGAIEVWVIYPDRRELVVHCAGSAAVTLSGVFTTDLLPDIEFDLDAILA